MLIYFKMASGGIVKPRRREQALEEMECPRSPVPWFVCMPRVMPADQAQPRSLLLSLKRSRRQWVSSFSEQTLNELPSSVLISVSLFLTLSHSTWPVVPSVSHVMAHLGNENICTAP